MTHISPRRKQVVGRCPSGTDVTNVVALDPYRTVIFPNRVREQRVAAGHLKLLAFAGRLPDIPYIRLSKIERGEVFARADEIARIADAIGVSVDLLLIDVDVPGFDIADWFRPFADGASSDDPEELRFAVLLAAAVRRHRETHPGLTAAAIDTDYGIAPVILSRIENALKGLSRWSPTIVAALCRLFGVDDAAGLRDGIETLQSSGELDRFVRGIADPELRRRRTAERVSALAAEVQRGGTTLLPDPPRRSIGTSPAAQPGEPLRPRLVPVFGMPDQRPGRIMLTRLDGAIEAPTLAGAKAFGVRVARATLGLGLPGDATIVVDPDRYPRAGGLALVRDGDAHRVVAVLIDREGSLIGCSTQPVWEIAIDGLDPADVAAVVAAHFI